MVAVPGAVAVLRGPSRSRPLLPGELGLFLFPSALTAGWVPHGLAGTQGLPPKGSLRSSCSHASLRATLGTCCRPLDRSWTPAEHGSRWLPPADFWTVLPPRPDWLIGTPKCHS